MWRMALASLVFLVCISGCGKGHRCTCGCEKTGKCVCPNCSVGCGFIEEEKK